MMCAGITVYSPLVRLGCGPGKHVAIVGIGGLGHFALLWAKALGAEVTAISHSPNKKEDALRLGADHFVSSGDKDWHKPLAFTFDFILNSADMTHQFDLDAYMSTMKVMGRFHNVGLPDEPLPPLKAQQLMPGGYYIGASHIGNAPEMEAMLKLASEKNIKPDIETLDLSADNCSQAVQRVKKNDVRYRFTLVNYDAVFGKRE
jgi:alcohol dehydrogenase (NADP+)